MEFSNRHPEFVGVEELLVKQREQVSLFVQWAENHDWNAFHRSHYDWWTFPINRPSTFGFGYTVFAAEIEELKSRPDFLRNLEEAARLLLLSWGWDASLNQEVAEPEMGQAWANWPIRWSKCTASLELFGLNALHRSSLAFASQLLDRGASFDYRGRDLAAEHRLRG